MFSVGLAKNAGGGTNGLVFRSHCRLRLRLLLVIGAVHDVRVDLAPFSAHDETCIHQQLARSAAVVVETQIVEVEAKRDFVDVQGANLLCRRRVGGEYVTRSHDCDGNPWVVSAYRRTMITVHKLPGMFASKSQ